MNQAFKQMNALLLQRIGRGFGKEAEIKRINGGDGGSGQEQGGQGDEVITNKTTSEVVE